VRACQSAMSDKDFHDWIAFYLLENEGEPEE
jgi:hypothetical protein